MADKGFQIQGRSAQELLIFFDDSDRIAEQLAQRVYESYSHPNCRCILVDL